MNAPQDHLLTIRLEDETATHERLVNVLRRRAPRVLAFTVFAEDDGTARATARLQATVEEARFAAAHVGKIVGVESVCLT